MEQWSSNLSLTFIAIFTNNWPVTLAHPMNYDLLRVNSYVMRLGSNGPAQRILAAEIFGSASCCIPVGWMRNGTSSIIWACCNWKNHVLIYFPSYNKSESSVGPSIIHFLALFKIGSAFRIPIIRSVGVGRGLFTPTGLGFTAYTLQSRAPSLSVPSSHCVCVCWLLESGSSGFGFWGLFIGSPPILDRHQSVGHRVHDRSHLCCSKGPLQPLPSVIYSNCRHWHGQIQIYGKYRNHNYLMVQSSAHVGHTGQRIWIAILRPDDLLLTWALCLLDVF